MGRVRLTRARGCHGQENIINKLLTYASSTGEEEEESGRSGDSWFRNTRNVRETSESDE